jgi:hypothetical protein
VIKEEEKLEMVLSACQGFPRVHSKTIQGFTFILRRLGTYNAGVPNSEQGCPTHIGRWTKFCSLNIYGPIFACFYSLKDCFKILGGEGQIKSFGVPFVARLPFVVHTS